MKYMENQDGPLTETTFQVQKANLELDKLQAEIDNLKRSNSLGAKIALYNPVFTVLIAVLGVFVSIDQFNKQQEHNRLQLEEQSKRDFATREQESKKNYWEEQNKTYKDAIDAAATIAGADSLESVKEERKKFWRLYWGIMSLVENRSVEGAMKDFGDSLEKWEMTQEKPLGMERLVYAIAHCGRKSLQNTWSPVDIGDLAEEGCPN